MIIKIEKILHKLFTKKDPLYSIFSINIYKIVICEIIVDFFSLKIS